VNVNRDVKGRDNEDDAARKFQSCRKVENIESKEETDVQIFLTAPGGRNILCKSFHLAGLGRFCNSADVAQRDFPQRQAEHTQRNADYARLSLHARRIKDVILMP